MGALTRAYDWKNSSLGAPDTWPQSLRLTVRLMLNSGHPMFIWWGPELIQFYNDAYRATMGPERHPSALGQRGKECWEEIWEIIGPMISFVMSGSGSTWDVDRLVPITRYGKREDVWWTFSYGPIDLEGGVGGVLVVCNDVTKQHLAQEEIKQHSRHLEQLFEQAPGFMAVVRGPDHVFEMTNDAYKNLVGNRNFMGRPVREVVPEAEGQGYFELLDEVYLTGKAHLGKRTPLKLQTDVEGIVKETHIDFVYQPIFGGDRGVSGIFIQGNDVTDDVKKERHLKLMNEELKHRVKNTLAIVNAIATQTFRGSEKYPEVNVFRKRTVALAEAHDLLTSNTWASARISDVVHKAIAPYEDKKSQFIISGPELLIGSKQTMSLALALHELATNSIKYGALSIPLGIVKTTWSEELQDRTKMFQFRWEEEGGPPIEPPKKQGFGSRLIEATLHADFGGTIEIKYPPTGLVCTLVANVENLRQAYPPSF